MDAVFWWVGCVVCAGAGICIAVGLVVLGFILGNQAVNDSEIAHDARGLTKYIITRAYMATHGRRLTRFRHDMPPAVQEWFEAEGGHFAERNGARAKRKAVTP